MTTSVPRGPISTPPARQLRLLANLAPAAAVLFGLTTIWLVISTLEMVGQLGSTTGMVTQSISVISVIVLVLSLISAVVAGLITYRLAVQVPRVLRGWQGALAERTRVLNDQ